MRPLTFTFWARILALNALLPTAVFAANVSQSGNVTPGHLTAWTTNGVVQDAGTATNPFANTFGLIGGPFCINSGPTTGAYNAFCFQADATTGGTVSIYNHAGATGGISFSVNGVAQGIPLVPLPTTAGDAACFTNTSGTMQDCAGSSTWLSSPPPIGNVAPNTGDFSTVNIGTLTPITGATLNLVGGFDQVITDPTLLTANPNFDASNPTSYKAYSMLVTWDSGATQTGEGLNISVISSATAPASGAVGSFSGGVVNYLSGKDSYGILGICRFDTSLSAVAGQTCASQWGLLRGVTVGADPNTVDIFRATSEADGTTNARSGLIVYNTTATNAVHSGVYVEGAIDYGIRVGDGINLPAVIEPTHPYSWQRKDGTEPFYVDKTGAIQATSITVGTSGVTLGFGGGQNIYFGGIQSISRNNSTGALTLATNASDITLSPTGVTTTAKQIVSTLVTGTAPFVVASTTLVANLHVATADVAPVSGLTGLGTGVATALGVNTGTAGSFLVNGQNISLTSVAWFVTAPTISSGFCTTPSIVHSNGTASFEINVGTACAASAGVIAMPTATNGWSCGLSDITSPVNVVVQTGTTASTVTVGNFSRTSGAATNFTSSDLINIRCAAY